MRTVVIILPTALCVLAATAASAIDNPLLGTWKLKSYVREAAATGERYNERGEHPDGYLSYAADGRMSAIITCDNRAKPQDLVPTNDERIRLFGTMISYAGTYTADAEKVTHHVDISCRPGPARIKFGSINWRAIPSQSLQRLVEVR